jgi:demethylmenaquinone methyltransferase/2-methoxy-6-polyprenyl-1,4-benzoquinol methylase
VVDWVFETVADRYDLGNDLMSLGWHTRWKRRLVEYAAPRPQDRVLDLATGTGDVAWMLAPHAREVVAVDNNPAMLVLAEAKRPTPAPGQVRFVVADAARLPFPDGSFDLVTCAYAGRGFPDLPAVVQEVSRVLSPGGRYWHLDFARQDARWWDRTVRGFMTVGGAALGVALHGSPRSYVYIPLTLRHYPGQAWLERRIAEAGLRAGRIETAGQLMAFNYGFKPE